MSSSPFAGHDGTSTSGVSTVNSRTQSAGALGGGGLGGMGVGGAAELQHAHLGWRPRQSMLEQ